MPTIAIILCTNSDPKYSFSSFSSHGVLLDGVRVPSLPPQQVARLTVDHWDTFDRTSHVKNRQQAYGARRADGSTLFITRDMIRSVQLPRTGFRYLIIIDQIMT
jgi:hypothetical protein